MLEKEFKSPELTWELWDSNPHLQKTQISSVKSGFLSPLFSVLRGPTWMGPRPKPPLKGPLYDRQSLCFAQFRTNWEFALKVWLKFAKKKKKEPLGLEPTLL